MSFFTQSSIIFSFTRLCLALIVIFSLGAKYCLGEDEENYEACPGTLNCYCSGVKAYCPDITELPSQLPDLITEVHLNGNKLESHNLLKSNLTGFTQVEFLDMRFCLFESIEAGAFSDMKKLKNLDLSHNNLKFIGGNTFNGLDLEALSLQNNPDLKLNSQAFNELKTRELYLNDCGMEELNPDAFLTITPGLKYLFLHGNSLQSIDESLKDLFTTLKYVSIGNNPWNCDCKLAWLKEAFKWELDRYSSSPEAKPVCQSPTALEGKEFKELSSGDFSCWA